MSAKYKSFQSHLVDTLTELSKGHAIKRERVITSPISSVISTNTRKGLLNFASSDYLGFANHPDIKSMASEGLLQKGFGLSSVRFICGTTDSHKALEKEISSFYGTDDTIIFPSAYAANSAIFEVLLTDEDAVFSDVLNHESIFHGIKLGKARSFTFKNRDINDLREKINEAKSARFKLIVSSSLFSANAEFAKVNELYEIAEQAGAVLMIDEAHGTGTIGQGGRGVLELHGALNKAEIITSTLEKSLGGSNGGFVTGKQEVIDILRQRARPYLFSNSISTYTVEASRKALQLLRENPQMIKQLQDNVAYFRSGAKKFGLKVLGNDQSPVCPILTGSDALAQKISDQLFEDNIYALPTLTRYVSPDLAAVRIQISSFHSKNDLDQCIYSLQKAGEVNGLI